MLNQGGPYESSDQRSDQRSGSHRARLIGGLQSGVLNIIASEVGRWADRNAHVKCCDAINRSDRIRGAISEIYNRNSNFVLNFKGL